MLELERIWLTFRDQLSLLKRQFRSSSLTCQLCKYNKESLRKINMESDAILALHFSQYYWSIQQRQKHYEKRNNLALLYIFIQVSCHQPSSFLQAEVRGIVEQAWQCFSSCFSSCLSHYDQNICRSTELLYCASYFYLKYT